MSCGGAAPAEAPPAALPPLPPGVRPHPAQVAGHRAEEGRSPALATDDGCFLKPLPSDSRGACELAFYESVAAAAAEAAASGAAPEAGSLAALAPLLPAFLGVAHPRGAAEGTYLRLRDATAAMQLPCVADIKLGFCTGDARFGAAYAAKCAAKDACTTSGALGFRLAGAQHWAPPAAGQGRTGPTWRCVRLERGACAALDRRGALAALEAFASCGGVADGAAVVRAALPRLAALADWLRAHRGTRFFGASVLLLFDAAPWQARPATDAAHAELRVDVKMVDFAHVAAAEGERDDNVLRGLVALVEALQAAAGVAACSV